MKKIKGFTMVEILITAIVLGIGVLTLHRTITHIKTTNEKIFKTMIANQLATEGAEILYQIRNTNFLKYESDKEIFVEKCINTGYLKDGKIVLYPQDATECTGNRVLCYDPCLAEFKSKNNINRCRLALDYYACITSPDYTGILNTGFYYIITNNSGLNSIIQCTGDYSNAAEEDCLNNENECCYRYRNEYSIYLNSGVRTPNYEGNEIGSDEIKHGIFYRHIEGMGVYNMAEANTIGGELLDINELSGTNAQEFRFCSTVARKGGENPAVEICSTMTNFIE